MGYKKSYERIDWENEQEAKSSPLGAINMNKMDSAIDVLDNRVVELDEKREKMESGILTLDFEGSSAISVTKENVTVLATDLRSNFTHTFDKPFTGKIDFECEHTYTYRVYITTETGTDELFCMGAYSKEVSDALSFSVEPGGAIIDSITITDYKNVLYKFDVPDHSITPEKIEPNYLAKITEKAESAEHSAITASEKAETAKEDADRAKEYADNAQAVAGVGIATKEIAGLVKGGKTAVSEGGELLFTKTTTDRTLTESHAGGLKINSMDGESQQKQYSGKQLFNRSSAVVGAEFFGSNGLSTTDNSVSVTTIQCEPSTNYTVSDMVGGQYARFNFLTENGEFISRTLVTVSSGTAILSTPENCYKLQIAVDNSMSQMMLAKGNVALPYEPYTNGASPNPDYPQEIKSVEVSEILTSGKNLWNLGNVSGTRYVNKTISLEPNTYTISAVITSTDTDSNESDMIFNYDDGSTLALHFTRNSRVSRKATFTKRVVSVNVYASNNYANSANDTFTFSDIQIEEGSVATPFEEFKEKSIQLSAPITLRGIGDVKDVLCKRDGVYGVVRDVRHRQILESDIAGKFYHDSSWGNANAFSISNFFSDSVRIANYTTIADVMCTHLTVDIPNNITAHAKNKIGQAYYNMFMSVDGITTETEAKNWVNANEVYVDYLLATPTFEPLPLADQIALHQLETFDTVTYISTDSEIEPIMEVEYGTSKVGAYAIKGMNTADANALKIEQLTTLTNDIATQLVAGSEV